MVNPKPIDTINTKISVSRVSSLNNIERIALFCLNVDDETMLPVSVLVSTFYASMRFAMLDAYASSHRLLGDIHQVDPKILKYEIKTMKRIVTGQWETTIETFTVNEVVERAASMKSLLASHSL